MYLLNRQMDRQRTARWDRQMDRQARNAFRVDHNMALANILPEVKGMLGICAHVYMIFHVDTRTTDETSVDANMTFHTHSAQELYELTLSENDWSSFQSQCLKSPLNFDSHLSSFHVADATCFKSALPFEASSPSDFIPHGMSMQFADPELFGSSQDSGRTNDVASPALGEFNGIGGGVNERQPDLNNPSVSTPLQNAFSSVQGRHSVAEVGATICSLVADYLKLLSGLNTSTSNTTLLQAGNEAVSAPDPNNSSLILIDSQGRRVKHQSVKAQKVVESGKKHGKNRGLR